MKSYAEILFKILKQQEEILARLDNIEIDTEEIVSHFEDED